MFEWIKNLLAKAWDWIKKIFVKIINFFANIKSWFTQASRLKKLKEDKNKVAVVIKETLDNGDYNVVNCLFDEETNTLDDAEVVQSEDIDQKTRDSFGNRDMIVLS